MPWQERQHSHAQSRSGTTGAPDSEDACAEPDNQGPRDNPVKPADWPKGKSWETLTLDTSLYASRHHQPD
jgi:hypothetical protein